MLFSFKIFGNREKKPKVNIGTSILLIAKACSKYMKSFLLKNIAKNKGKKNNINLDKINVIENIIVS